MASRCVAADAGGVQAESRSERWDADLLKAAARTDDGC
jgi:hypothetical protein